MKILVVGSGGREHAIAQKLVDENQVETVFVAPGNAGMESKKIICLPIDEIDQRALIQFAKHEKIAFTIIGPEAPLLAGIVDAFIEAGLKVFGPTKKAALIEGSKDFAKQFMEKYHIPTAKSATFTDYQAAMAYLKQHGVPIVIKADGLAAGKGVAVALEMEEAVLSLTEMLLEEKFGEASRKVVLEDFLIGEEFSLMAFVNGEKVYPLVAAQDHKRAYEDDLGPNTGGMGAYSPVIHIAKNIIEQSVNTILKPAAKGLVAEGRYYRGILYAGLILTETGPKVIEFNARFGDPETQVVLPRLESDFAQVIIDLLADKDPVIQFKQTGVHLGVVLASAGYPNQYEKGHLLTGTENLSADVDVYYAGVSRNGERLVGNGGRVLLVTTEEATIQQARAKIYKEMKKLDNKNFFYRLDIGVKAIDR